MLDDFKQAFRRYNNAHVQMIIINVVIFVVMGVFVVIPSWFKMEVTIDNYVALPSVLSEFLVKPWTIITYQFVHANLLHILFNMLWLYWFGKLFVEYLGSDKMIALYILGGIFGGLFYLLAYNVMPYLEGSQAILVGASASVLAIVVGAATLLPNYEFYLMFLGPVKIKYIAAFSVVTSLLATAGLNAGGNIAHLGGALLGFIYIKQLQAGVNWGGWITIFIEWVKDLFKAKPKVRVSYRNEAKEAKTKSSDKVSQDEIDNILDKISAGGYESLSRDEKEKLFNASKKTKE